MMLIPNSLTKIVNTLKSNHVHVSINKSTIKIDVDLKKIPFQKTPPLLYLILNKFENLYLIRIEGVPFCLMPDTADHLIYTKKSGINYTKDAECQKCKYRTSCPGWMTDNTVKPRPPAVPDLPRELVFEVTSNCNLNCPICFTTKSTQELPLDKIKTLIDECGQLGIKHVRFTGGEPLLYKNIEEALYYAKNKDLYITVNTNATVINKALERALKECANNLLISFQGFNSTSERRLTQSTIDFKEKLHNITRLNSHIPIVRLGTIISRPLINNFSKYFCLVASLGIKNWELYRPMTNMQLEDFHITAADFINLMKRVKLKKLQGADIMIANPLPFCITENSHLSHHVLTGAEFDDGHSRLIVDSQGFLKPSYCICKDLGSTIKTAWKNPFLTKMHSLNYLPQKCQDCFSLKWCKGGSRHWAKLAHNSYFAPDPLMKN